MCSSDLVKDITLIKEINRLRKEKNAVILAHFYQRPDIQDIADFIGDSLKLSQEAAKTSADIIVFAGVHFMAESAGILSPQKTVILPRLEAGCPMADMVTAQALQEKQKELPGTATVCYVNSSADVKAVSDICCTSANAINVVNSVKEDTVLMVPDKNLALNTAKFTSKKVIPWEGFCPTHHLLKEEDVIRAKEEHPSAPLVVHPECPPDVVKHADHVCSTSGMYNFVRENTSKAFIIGTEQGILYRMRKENPDKKFYLPADNVMICPNMKLTRLIDVLSSLESLSPIVKVEEYIRKKAYRALKRMIDVPRD